MNVVGNILLVVFVVFGVAALFGKSLAPDWVYLVIGFALPLFRSDERRDEERENAFIDD